MKKVIKNVKLMVLLFVGLSASASNMIPNSNVFSNALDHVVEVKTTKVVVRNAKGKIIYQVMVNDIDIFLDKLDLSMFPDGTYSLEVEKAFEIKIKPFSVVYHQVIFDSENTYSIFKPIITTQGKLVYLTRLSFDKRDVNVKVFDNENNLIYSERIGDEVELNRIYDFSKRFEKKFKVVLNTDGRKFVQNIEF